jgi:hypothetical protein
LPDNRRHFVPQKRYGALSMLTVMLHQWIIQQQWHLVLMSVRPMALDVRAQE